MKWCGSRLIVQSARLFMTRVTAGNWGVMVRCGAMKRAQIEPELLTLFRLSNVFWLVVYAPGLPDQASNLSFLELPLLLLGRLTAAVMLLYLYSGWLRRRLGTWYLPLGLTITTLGALVGQWYTILWRVEHGAAQELNGESGRLFILLFVPLVIIAAQYNLRGVIVFTTVTAVLQALLMQLLVPLDGAPIDLIKDDIVGRLFVYPVVGFIVVRLVAGQKTAREALTAKNIKLTRYATTVERLAVSHERNRLARELHDTLAHTLSAVAVQLEALNKQLEKDPVNARHTVKQLQDVTRSGLQESRRALQALRASPLEDLGLTLAMRQLVDSVAERSGMRITLTMSSDLDGLSPEVEQSIYRITEEALNNAARHAQAQAVTISLHREQHRLRLTVSDDGIGFDPDTVSLDDHYGLVGMRERALLCSGQLDIVSAPATGTTIRLTVEDGL